MEETISIDVKTRKITRKQTPDLPDEVIKETTFRIEFAELKKLIDYAKDKGWI